MKRNGNGRVFQRRSRHSGKRLPTYWLEFYVNGRQRRESADTEDYQEATRLLRKKLGQVAEGRIKPREVERTTVGELLALFEKDYQDKERTPPTGHLEALRHALGHRQARQVTTEDLDDLTREWRQKGVKWEGRDPRRVRPLDPATCDRYLATLRRAFHLGRRKRSGFSFDLHFPMSHSRRRGKNMAPAIVAAVRAHFSPILIEVADLAHRISVRKGQLRNATRADVILQDRVPVALSWDGDQTKNEEPHYVALSGRALEVVKTAWATRRLHCPYLFHAEDCGKRPRKPGQPCLGKLRSEWNRACKKAGLPVGRQNSGYVFHDLRHSALTNLVATGASNVLAMSLSGHRTQSAFQGYVHTNEDAQKRALEAVDALLANQQRQPAAK